MSNEAKTRPAADGAVVHRWSDLPTDRPMPLIERQRVVGDRMMISRVTLHRGFVVPAHAHENEQLGVVLSGKVRFLVGGEVGDDPTSAESAARPGVRELVLSAGEVIHLPSNVVHAAQAVETAVILDVFSPPSETTGVDR